MLYSASYYIYNTVLDVGVILSEILSVCSFAIETTFMLSNFKTKHIFGILMAQRRFLKLFGAPETWGATGAPFFFFSFTAAEGALTAASLPRRAREIPPKAGVSRVYKVIWYWVVLSVRPLFVRAL